MFMKGGIGEVGLDGDPDEDGISGDAVVAEGSHRGQHASATTTYSSPAGHATELGSGQVISSTTTFPPTQDFGSQVV